MGNTQPRVLGADVGGTNTKIGVVDLAGNIDSFRSIPTDAQGDSPESFLKRFYEQLDQMLADSQHNIVGIGVSMHGELDVEHRGPVIAGNTPALRNLDMRGLLTERYQLPVNVYNDLTAHALGEYYFGCGQGSQRFMCLAIGTGLGAGVIINGKPLYIDGGNSGNTGLVILDPDGPVDYNGIRGSAEALCGTPGIERLALARYGHALAAREVITAAREGNDPIASDIMRQIGLYLGHTLATLSVIFYPYKIALTGGTVAAGSVLVEACREQYDRLVGDFFRDISANTNGHYQVAEIVLGEKGSETGILGAAIELLRQHQGGG